ncbi:MAG TPA: TetR family transcriptional regulator [Conexibacter sp.]
MSQREGAPVAARREELLRVARAAFLERGYDGCGTRDIARRLGIQPGSLYHYIDSKEALLVEILDAVQTPGRAALEAARQAPLPADERLASLIGAHVDVIAQDPAVIALLFAEVGALPAAEREATLHGLRAYRRGFGALVADGVAARLLRRRPDPRLATLACLGALNSLHRWYDPAGRRSPDELAAQFQLLLLDGLANPDGAAREPLDEDPPRVLAFAWRAGESGARSSRGTGPGAARGARDAGEGAGRAGGDASESAGRAGGDAGEGAGRTREGAGRAGGDADAARGALLATAGDGAGRAGGDADAARGALLATAGDLFATRGFEATTTREIAAALGVSKATLYHHIRDKQELLFALIQAAQWRSLARLERIVAADADPASKLRAAIAQHVLQLTGAGVGARLLLREARALTPQRRAIVRADERSYTTELAAIVADGQRVGAFRPELDAEVVALAVLGAVNWIDRWHRPDGPWPPHALAEGFADVLLDGLRAFPTKR